MNLLMQAENCGVEYFSSCEFQMSYIIAIFNFNGIQKEKFIRLENHVTVFILLIFSFFIKT